MERLFPNIKDSDWLVGAQDLAARIDSEILLRALINAGKRLGDQDISLIGGYFYNRKTGEIEKND